MQTHTTIRGIREAVKDARAADRSIALVPTMGNLHEGHISLVEHAGQISDVVISTIFVNPLQFGPGEDLDSYPRTLEDDTTRLIQAGAHHLFAPNVREMYPEQARYQTEVRVPGLSDIHCGQSRPTHFAGVTTVVSMLFNLIHADVAVFGKKDFQQLAIIRKMVADLHIPIEIVGCPIVREKDGLAMSSRNNYLTQDERAIAPRFKQILQDVATAIKGGDRDFLLLEEDAKQQLRLAGFKPDYLSVCNSQTLEPATSTDQRLVILGAAWLGKPRLLDNIEIKQE